MSAWTDACEVCRDGLLDVIPFLKSKSDEGRYVLTDKGRLSEEFQKRYGDAVANSEGKLVTVEFKSEQSNKHGNLFLETWSNRQRFTPGWMHNLDVDLLLYYFIDERRLFSVPFVALRRWAFGHDDKDGQIYRYRERRQGKYAQFNDTWGRCVPITDLKAAFKIRTYQFWGDDGNHTEVND